MNEQMLAYFNGEKQGAFILLACGIFGGAAAAIFIQERFQLRSFAITLALFSLLQLAIGIGLLIRTGPQVEALQTKLKESPQTFAAEEGARMSSVQRTFTIATRVEVVLLVICTLVAFAMKRTAISGVALGILINAAVLLAFDLIAEQRADVWRAAVSDFETRATQ